MDRRTFLARSAGLAVCALNNRGSQPVMNRSAVPPEIRLEIDARRTLGTIPANFVGLGYEISSVARPGLLSAPNRLYVQLVRTLGTQGVIRIGGNTSDYASFGRDAQAVSAPKSTVVNEANFRELGTFLDATGWKLIWGLNLGGGTEQQVVEEAQAVAASVKTNLLAFEIGNEPDLFGRGAAHRPDGYKYENYLEEYRRYKTAIRSKLPDAPFAGPDVASATDWVTRFAADEGSDLKLLTHHYYRECANPTSTLDKLLRPDPKLEPELEKLRAASETSHVPYRICETNSFCRGGQPGVSDMFGSALWVLDYMFTLASANAAGVNMETGVNQLGFISSYSPIRDAKDEPLTATPEYYGMLAFARAARGQRVTLDYDTADVNLAAYAVIRDLKHLCLTVINKDESRPALMSVATKQNFVRANLMRLAGASLESKDRVTFGGSVVDASGAWKLAQVELLRLIRDECEIHVPAASAAIVNWEA